MFASGAVQEVPENQSFILLVISENFGNQVGTDFRLCYSVLISWAMNFEKLRFVCNHPDIQASLCVLNSLHLAFIALGMSS